MSLVGLPAGVRKFRTGASPRLSTVESSLPDRSSDADLDKETVEASAESSPSDAARPRGTTVYTKDGPQVMGAVKVTITPAGSGPGGGDESQTSDCNRCFVRSTIYAKSQCMPPFGGFKLKNMRIVVIVVKNQFGAAKWSAPRW